ncbi:hypothetical protein LB519_08765 [Mesorhizobium sp. AD1-1]|uniref:hypothetical protein n=1 Tax=Mesorhizobium sp. AD1-1 TaxID=2876621 RepID=UPI001CCF6E80|nr:hypothetical protein [Mesorhizobium sp. AD1-1]MBZ9717938.1 hypothetical protein [Mesorhizobium sp. AD1-1]
MFKGCPFPNDAAFSPLIVADREMVANSMAQDVSNWPEFWKKQTKSCRDRRLDFKFGGRGLAIDGAAAPLAMVAGSSLAVAAVSAVVMVRRSS